MGERVALSGSDFTSFSATDKWNMYDHTAAEAAKIARNLQDPERNPPGELPETPQLVEALQSFARSLYQTSTAARFVWGQEKHTLTFDQVVAEEEEEEA